MTPTAIPLQSDAALLVLGRLRSSEKPEARGLHIGKRSEFNGVLPGKLRSGADALAPRQPPAFGTCGEAQLPFCISCRLI
jgi:hypothetical protein